MKYRDLDVSQEILQAVERMGFTDMTEIQEKAIPAMLDGYELIGKAPTGTGKTCAFGIPIVERIVKEEACVQGLILAPTRELAVQIRDDLRDLTYYMPWLKVVAVYGGQPINKQTEALKKHPQILVATPGRLIDLLKRRAVNIDDAWMTVLDEADEMLNMGFVKDVRYILDKLPSDKQLCMFSATLSREVMDISWMYQKDPLEITVRPVEDSKPKITQYCIESGLSERFAKMVQILRRHRYQKTMVFCNTKYMTESLARQVQAQGFRAQCLNGDMPQSARNRIMKKFREGAMDVLVATDVAARGLDIDGVDAVFSYEIPNDNGFYLHRIGRTGRAKKEGVSFIFYTPEERPHLRDLARYTRSEITPVDVKGDGSFIPNGKSLED